MTVTDVQKQDWDFLMAQLRIQTSDFIANVFENRLETAPEEALSYLLGVEDTLATMLPTSDLKRAARFRDLRNAIKTQLRNRRAI